MKFTFLALCLVLLSACYYDKKEVLYPKSRNGCDTVNATYSKTVAPIISSNCLSCHNSTSAAANGGGFNLEGYNNLFPYSGQGGVLIKSITQEPGVSPMPPGGKLSECEITEVTTWINNGAPNN